MPRSEILRPCRGTCRAQQTPALQQADKSGKMNRNPAFSGKKLLKMESGCPESCFQGSHLLFRAGAHTQARTYGILFRRHGRQTRRRRRKFYAEP